MRPTILVVDDDPGVRYTLRELLEEADMRVVEAEDGQAALDWLAKQRADLVVSDLAMPGLDGLALLEKFCHTRGTPTILITADGDERTAVKAMKLGALDYFAKPFDIDMVLAVITRAVDTVRREQENEQLRAELHLSRHMVFESEAMKRIALLVQRVGPRDVTVLITGPSGTGKELIAQAIQSISPREDKPFVRFNCAAVPRQLAEAELFGHSRGAFTGANRARLGLFREADGGTLLLDEVAELGPDVQTKLLRVLQEGRLRPVGADREEAVDVRLLAATNQNLADRVTRGEFREDLYYRLNVVQVELPSLAERVEDVVPLVEFFLRKYAERFGVGSIQPPLGLMDRMVGAAYPGNVRELEHAIERLVALSPAGRLDLEVLEGGSGEGGSGLGLKERVEAFERGLLAGELKRCAGNRSEAARRLGIGRVTLLDKLKKYALK